MELLFIILLCIIGFPIHLYMAVSVASDHSSLHNEKPEARRMLGYWMGMSQAKLNENDEETKRGVAQGDDARKTLGYWMGMSHAKLQESDDEDRRRRARPPGMQKRSSEKEQWKEMAERTLGYLMGMSHAKLQEIDDKGRRRRAKPPGMEKRSNEKEMTERTLGYWMGLSYAKLNEENENDKKRENEMINKKSLEYNKMLGKDMEKRSKIEANAKRTLGYWMGMSYAKLKEDDKDDKKRHISNSDIQKKMIDIYMSPDEKMAISEHLHQKKADKTQGFVNSDVKRVIGYWMGLSHAKLKENDEHENKRMLVLNSGNTKRFLNSFDGVLGGYDSKRGKYGQHSSLNKKPRMIGSWMGMSQKEAEYKASNTASE